MRATQPKAIPPPACSVLGVPVWGLSMAGFLDLAFAQIRERAPTLFTTTNAHSLVVAQANENLAAHFQGADVVLPDGMLAVWGGRICGGAIRERVPGPDFFQAFLARAESEGVSVFFLGTTDENLAAIQTRCTALYPRLQIRGLLAPPFGDFDASTDQRLIDAVNTARPDALFVAMTAPKQELWLSRNFAAIEAPFAMGVGAAFDFFTGRKRRAPSLVGKLGGEWLFRLLSEPRRLWRRELDAAVFLWLLLLDRLGIRKPRKA